MNYKELLGSDAADSEPLHARSNAAFTTEALWVFLTLYKTYACMSFDIMKIILEQNAHLRLGQGVAGAPSVEALPDTILLRAIRADDCLNFVKGGIAAVGAEQAPRLLQSNT